ncbi:hypothetical protein CSB93_5577 [Pseudomonas paraeruginosa]|uniref:Uncharacterized protein n=1 Tax=Pseudomonas paraeruginosa TaxID=2994495 RepID=A0A2R3ISE8_9PSED|nr:hypothetical protein CSB93_5577 [Pseudomonas paraeruginosa]AWE89337.1 hypothetical protein CSC28_4375 [Pseudomonas paraeruginosa]
MAQEFSEEFSASLKPPSVLQSMRAVGVFSWLIWSETAKKTRHKID